MQNLLAQLENDGEARKMALDSLRGSVLDLSVDPVGCRAVQLALEVTTQREAADLAIELVGHTRAAIDSKHANHVVQKIVEVLPPSMTSWMAEELLGTAGEIARHHYGCRVICRLLEHSATERGTYALINELLMETKDLSRHAYGYHVVRCILEHGLPEHRRRVARALCGGLQRNAKHRHASFVVEKALAFCDEHMRTGLAEELLARPENIADLARHQYGRHVVSQLVQIPGDCSQKAIDSIHIMRPQVQATKHGRRLLEQLRPHLEASAVA
jgi:pumilio RNA-binding family